MKNKNRKAVIDDGMNPELVRGADFDGYNGIPIIKKPDEIIIPKCIFRSPSSVKLTHLKMLSQPMKWIRGFLTC